ncbi:hypothetical protein [Algibacter mikhailovii]|uniref:hypothetical protein n=1 Tax=Algibacter mikhailovii TaxID=425498 RepID=UPI0024946A64|nr:hypothetical protein [Algibacter mikhailovii]
MTSPRNHISFRALTVILGLALLIPSLVKFVHIFEHSEHQVCVSEDATHIHKIDLDCEFQKFQITNYALSDIDIFQSTIVDYITETPFLTYKFLNKHRPLSFSLRGPPALV